jgi:hypothetical protein
MTETSRHAGSASRAALTAASRSPAFESGTRASTSPLAGFVTSTRSDEPAAVHDPPM